MLALLLAWVIRPYAFTVYSVPSGGLPPHSEWGNRVVVIRIDGDRCGRGETIVFAVSGECVVTPKSKYTGKSMEG